MAIPSCPHTHMDRNDVECMRFIGQASMRQKPSQHRSDHHVNIRRSPVKFDQKLC